LHSRAVSEVVSGIVLFAVVLALSLALFLYTMTYLDYTKASTEYGYVKTIFNKIGDAITGPRSSFTIELTYPHEAVALGYRFKPLNITIVLGDGAVNRTVNIAGCYVLEARVRESVVSSPQPVIIRGVNETIVNDLSLVPFIYEYYSNGSSILVIDTCRIYYYVKAVNNTYSMTIMIHNFTSINSVEKPPLIYGQGHIVISTLSTTTLAEYANISTISVTLPDSTTIDLNPKGINFMNVKVAVRNIGVLIG